MKISCRKKIAIHSRKDALLIPVYKNIKPLRLITGKKIDDEIQKIIESDYFNFEEGEVKTFYVEINSKLKKIYLLFIPKEQEHPRVYMELGSKIAKRLKQDKIETISLISFEDIYNEKKDFSSTQGFMEGLMFGLYSFDKYKCKKEAITINEVEIITSMLKLKRFIDVTAEEWNNLFKNINIARDLINTPSNNLTPEDFVNFVKENVASNVNIKVWDQGKIIKEGINLIDAVGKGSSNPPFLIILSYKGDPTTSNNIALVGKGVTFDSGGTNLKPTGSIETMKEDMAGAAISYAIINHIAEQKLKINITAYIPLVENIIGGNAIKSGDIVTSASGKSVEILNTDAEGRLILADALYLATKTDPEVIIDIATLTGACVVALGPFCAGLFCNRKFLSKQLSDISDKTCEDIWELPIYEGYEKGIRSDFADIQNMSTFKREGGAIHAAIFLKQFVDNYPWIHLDIAGPSYLSTTHPIFGNGATGFGVRLLYKFIKNHYTGTSNA